MLWWTSLIKAVQTEHELKFVSEVVISLSQYFDLPNYMKISKDRSVYGKMHLFMNKIYDVGCEYGWSKLFRLQIFVAVIAVQGCRAKTRSVETHRVEIYRYIFHSGWCERVWKRNCHQFPHHYTHATVSNSVSSFNFTTPLINRTLHI